MKKTYKGFDITVERDTCLGGWSQVYYTVYKDNWEIICDFTSGETVREVMTGMKERVDEFIRTKGASEDLEMELN